MPRRPFRDPLAPLGAPEGVNSEIVDREFARENRQRAALKSEGGDGGGASVAVLRVRRPTGNTRGPLPGQGRNQGAGVVDVADRTGQGAAHGGITGQGATPKPDTNVTVADSHTATQTRASTKVPGNARPLDVAQATDEFAEPKSQVKPQQISDPRPETDPLAGPNIDRLVRAFQQVPELGLSQLIDDDGVPTFELPSYMGSQVYFDPNSQQYSVQGFSVEGLIPDEGMSGILATDVFIRDSSGTYINTRTGQAAPSEISGLLDGQIPIPIPAPADVQNAARRSDRLLDLAIDARVETDQQRRAFLFGEIQAILADERAANRQEDAQEFQTEERLASQDFEADQAEESRRFQERLTELDQDFALRRDGLNNAFTAHQNNIDRALQTARDDRDFALRQADFELAQRRFRQESQLANAQFALGLFQSFSQNPELLYSLQSSGLLEQFQQVLPGLNISGLLPPLLEEGGALADVDLPRLAELQRMPADVQNQTLVMLAIQTGVKRETLLAEIQRRASGQGLAGSSNNLQRIPA